MTDPATEAGKSLVLGSVRIVECADDPGSELVGRLLAEMGAEVIKIEPPGGCASRNTGPFLQGRHDVESSLAFWYYNSNKKSVVLDVSAAAGRARLDDVLADADVLIVNQSPALLAKHSLDLKALQVEHTRLIILSVTAFGLSGPWADYKSSDLVALAAGGPLISCGYDDHSIPPIRPGGNQGYHTAASFGMIGLMLALLDRQRTDRGQIVDVAMHDACAVNIELANPYWFYPRANVQRQTCRHAQPIPTQPALFCCRDGRYVYYTLILSEQRAWDSLVGWMDEFGMAANLTEAAYSSVLHRQQNMQEIQTMVECFFLVQDAETAFHEGQARGLPIGVLNAPEDLFHDEHLIARNFFTPLEQAGRSVPYPGPPICVSSAGHSPRRRAPFLGEHDKEILARPSTTDEGQSLGVAAES